jgi:hypothetical protein
MALTNYKNCSLLAAIIVKITIEKIQIFILATICSMHMHSNRLSILLSILFKYYFLIISLLYREMEIKMVKTVAMIFFLFLDE